MSCDIHGVGLCPPGCEARRSAIGVGQHERMLRWFAFDHLPAHLQAVSERYYQLANALCVELAPGPERTVALRKLLESKDAAVRARVQPGS